MRLRELLGIVALIAPLFLVVVADCQAETWNGITPLKSTRGDVERVLGKENEHGYHTHELGKVRVFYGGGMKRATDCIGRASTNVVGWISISLDIPMNLRDLSIDRQQFTEVKRAGVLDLRNKTLGISYSVDASDMEIYDITYWPSAAACEALSGPKS